MAEKWKDVIGYEGLYQVSSWGRLYSYGRTITVRTRWGNERTYKTHAGFLYPWSMGRYGHLYVGLRLTKGKMKTHAVHRLVLEAFVGPCPEGMECCHNDGDPTFNHVSNLRWDTPKSNMKDRDLHGRHIKGSKTHWARLTESQIPSIRQMLVGIDKEKKKWSRLRMVGKHFNVSPYTIYDVMTGHTWKHVPS